MRDIIDYAYLATSATAGLVSWRSRSRNGAICWLGLSIGLLALGLLRLTQAAVWIDDYLLRGLQLNGWYGHRRLLQVVCIAAAAFILLIAFARLRVRLRRRPLTLAAGAFLFLALFATVRASSLHWTDAILSRRIGYLTISELTQILLLLTSSAAAVFELSTSGRRGLNAAIE